MSTGTGTIAPDRAGDADGGGEVVLSAAGLSAGLGAAPYVRDVDIEVRRGEVVALLGANGAGKTTTLMALSGQVRPVAGEVRLGGRPTRARMEQRVRDGLAVVTQERCVFMGLTLRDNLLLGRGDIDDALDLFPELSDHLGRKVGLLSGGQQQMLAVGRALASRPLALLADEVSLGLAPMLVDRLLSAITTAARRAGVGVILVEQHVHKALRHSDRACVLRRGRIELTGTSAELAARPDEIERLYL